MAEYYYRKALSLRPDDPWVVHDVARFLISSEVNVSEGLELIGPALEAFPDNPDFLYTYALALNKTGRNEEARIALQQSWDLTPYYDHKQFTLKKEIVDQLEKTRQGELQ
jgi:tetratricopeptide (TPR) repeat protein